MFDPWFFRERCRVYTNARSYTISINKITCNCRPSWEKYTCIVPYYLVSQGRNDVQKNIIIISKTKIYIYIHIPPIYMDSFPGSKTIFRISQLKTFRKKSSEIAWEEMRGDLEMSCVRCFFFQPQLLLLT